MEFLNVAVELSLKNVENKQGGPFGCVVVDDTHGKVIACGSNSVVQDCDPTAHAEIVALRRACQEKKTWDLSDCIVYSSCEPCPMCYSALMWARVKHIYYANTRQDAHDIGFQDDALYEKLRGKTLPMTTRLLDSRALDVFKLWNEQSEAQDKY